MPQAKIVRRRTPTFPSKTADYYDFTPWGSGYVRVSPNNPSAIVLNEEGMFADLRTGVVAYDKRFDKRLSPTG